MTLTRTFDELGRLTAESGTGDGTASRSLSYDLAGLLTEVGHPDGTIGYEYDDRGLLTDVTGPAGTAGYEYDLAGRMTERVDAAGTTTFAWTPRNELETLADPATGTTLTYTWDDASQLTTIEYGTSGATRNYTYDTRGRLVSDSLIDTQPMATSTVVYGYDTDSNLTSRNVTLSANTDAGHVWQGARWYQPATGTFLSRDTIRGELSTPVTLNRYTYANNSPLNYWDPDGHLAQGTVGPKIDGQFSVGCAQTGCHQDRTGAGGDPYVWSPPISSGSPSSGSGSSAGDDTSATPNTATSEAVEAEQENYSRRGELLLVVPQIGHVPMPPGWNSWKPASQKAWLDAIYEGQFGNGPNLQLFKDQMGLIGSPNGPRPHVAPGPGTARDLAEFLSILPVIGDLADGGLCFDSLTSGNAAGAAVDCGAMMLPLVGAGVLRKLLNKVPGINLADEAVGTSDARFTVDSAGNTTVRAQSPQGWIELSEHAAQRLTRRDIPIEAVDEALTTQPFKYFHHATWKTGYYDAPNNLFVGSVDDTITTVFYPSAGQGYIDNLLANSP